MNLDYLGEFIFQDAFENTLMALERPDVLFLVAEMDGRLVAALGIIVAPRHYNKDFTLAQEFSWAFDKTIKGLPEVMIREAKKVLKSRGVKGFCTSAEANNKVLNRYYKIKGWKEVDTLYFMEL